MQFGHSLQTDVNTVDFSLPDVPSGLPGTPSEKFKFYLGPPKLGHKHWHGSLYPAHVKNVDHHAEVVNHFNFVELNASFFSIPKPEVVEGWMESFSLQPGFKVAPKFFRAITHVKRLIGAEEQTAKFIEFCKMFKQNLGPTLMQLNDNWGPVNLPVLEKYLNNLPTDLMTHVELRHPGWFEKEVFRTVTELFKTHNVGTVLTDTNDRRDVLHMTLTTPKAYIRFLGNNNHPSDKTRLENWARKITQWKDAGLEDVYFTLSQPFDETFAAAVETAREAFKDLLTPEPPVYHEKRAPESAA